MAYSSIGPLSIIIALYFLFEMGQFQQAGKQGYNQVMPTYIL